MDRWAVECERSHTALCSPADCHISEGPQTALASLEGGKGGHPLVALGDGPGQLQGKEKRLDLDVFW